MRGRSRASQYLRGERDPRDLRTATAPEARSGQGFLADLAATWRLTRAYLRGDYRDVRLRSILSVVAGLLYFLSPIDLIPDLFLLIGFTDDVVVLALVFRVVRQELAAFRAWEWQHVGLGATVIGTVREA
jgi:uncharacterized membrane protein YkvA (DUF1232 family)